MCHLMLVFDNLETIPNLLAVAPPHILVNSMVAGLTKLSPTV